MNSLNSHTSFCEQAQSREESSLSPFASLSKDHLRLFPAEDDYRLPYKRDIDRIIHSKAYARYTDKTQVVYLVNNDHITHRGLHVQLVSNFARGIAEILSLNVDLVESIALGHDVGHPPFGHEGEEYLSSLSEEFGNGPFAHPLQSCRLLSEIEKLNLGLAVYDGFLCHDGGMCGPKYEPIKGKGWQQHQEDKMKKKADPHTNIWPTTLEGCLVKMSDTISYLSKDIEDGISLGIISREDIPITILGQTNREILNSCACDIIKNSYDKPFICMSEAVYDALQTLRKFNFHNIYLHPKLKVESSKVKRAYRYLFETLLTEHESLGKESYLWRHYLDGKEPSYLKSNSSIQLVVDYISGMTDSFFINTIEKILIPRQIPWG